MDARMNRAMQSYMNETAAVEIPGHLLSDPRIATLLDSTPLYTRDGTLVLPWTPNWRSLRRGFPNDLTGYECLVNHIHLNSIIPDSPSAPRLRLKLALILGERLVARLREAWPVTVIVSFDGMDAIVRVHRTRSGEAWLADDLERYTEGILVIKGQLEERCSNVLMEGC